MGGTDRGTSASNPRFQFVNAPPPRGTDLHAERHQPGVGEAVDGPSREAGDGGRAGGVHQPRAGRHDGGRARRDRARGMRDNRHEAPSFG